MKFAMAMKAKKGIGGGDQRHSSEPPKSSPASSVLMLLALLGALVKLRKET